MVFARSFLTGRAESVYPPVSHALLAGHHTATRAFAIAIHQTAQYAGPILTGFLAGWIAEHYAPEHRSSAAAIVLLMANLLAAPSAALLGYSGDHAPINTVISALALLFPLAAWILFSARRLKVI